MPKQALNNLENYDGVMLATVLLWNSREEKAVMFFASVAFGYWNLRAACQMICLFSIENNECRIQNCSKVFLKARENIFMLNIKNMSSKLDTFDLPIQAILRLAIIFHTLNFIVFFSCVISDIIPSTIK